MLAVLFCEVYLASVKGFVKFFKLNLILRVHIGAKVSQKEVFDNLYEFKCDFKTILTPLFQSQAELMLLQFPPLQFFTVPI